jgi:hypothetical protein
MVAQAAMSISSAARGAAVVSPAKGRLRSCERSVILLSTEKSHTSSSDSPLEGDGFEPLAPREHDRKK